MRVPDPVERPVLTVKEAAAILGIGTDLAYESARTHLATEGREGLPAIRIGEHRLVVPTASFRAWLGIEPARIEPPADKSTDGSIVSLAARGGVSGRG